MLTRPACPKRAFEPLGQRPVEADQERPAPLRDGLLEEGVGHERLAGPGRSLHPQAQGLHLESRQSARQPGAEARELPLVRRDLGVDVYPDLERLGEEVLDLGHPPVRSHRSRTEQLGDPLGEPATLRGIDHPRGVESGGVQPNHAVVRAVDEVVEVQVGVPRVDRLELLADALQAAPDLIADRLHRPARICLGQPRVGLHEGPVLLLDQQHPAGAVDDGEVDLAVHRVAAVLARPVDPVEDGIGGRQGLAEITQGLELRPMSPGQLQPPDVGGDETGHQATYSAGSPGPAKNERPDLPCHTAR